MQCGTEPARLSNVHHKERLQKGGGKAELYPPWGSREFIVILLQM